MVENSNLETLHKICGSGSLALSPCAAGGSLWDDDWIRRYQLMSLGDNHKCSLY